MCEQLAEFKDREAFEVLRLVLRSTSPSTQRATTPIFEVFSEPRPCVPHGGGGVVVICSCARRERGAIPACWQQRRRASYSRSGTSYFPESQPHTHTHFPKISACPVSQRATAQNTPHRRTTPMLDSGSLDGELGGGGGHCNLRSSQEKQGIQLPSKPQICKIRAMRGLMHFAGPTDKLSREYTGGSGELSSVARDLLWRHVVSTPKRPQSNGVVGHAV